MPDPSPAPIWTEWSDQPTKAASWPEALADERFSRAVSTTVLQLCVLSQLLWVDHAWVFAGIAILGIGFVLVEGVFGVVANRRFNTRLRNIMELPSDPPQFPSVVEYRDGRFAYGKDYGLTILADGMVHFQGQRSHFSIPQRRTDYTAWNSPLTYGPWDDTPLICWYLVQGFGRDISLKLLRSLPSPKNGLLSARTSLTFAKPLSERFLYWGHDPPHGAQLLLPPPNPHPNELLRSKRELIPILAFPILGIPLSLVFAFLLKPDNHGGGFDPKIIASLAMSAFAGRILLWWIRYFRLSRRIRGITTPVGS